MGQILSNIVAVYSKDALANGASFVSDWILGDGYPSLIVTVRTDQPGSLSVEFSPDADNIDSSLSYSVAANANEVHRVVITRQYFRVKMLNNSGSAQTFMRLQALVGMHNILSSPLNQSLSTDADSITSRSVIFNTSDSGALLRQPCDVNGHMEVAIHSPRLPFGSIHTESLTPAFQVDAVYGLNGQLVQADASGSGSATAVDSSFVCSTGTTIFSQASLQSRRRLRYRPGQGVVARFAGNFTSPVAQSYQVMGIGHAEDGVFFGYKDTDFGILYSSRGKREVQTLTIAVASTTAENVTVTLNGVAFSVAVTNSGSTLRTAYEISLGTYAGWKAEAIGSTVRFIADSVGNRTGAFTLAGTTAAGTFAETQAGAAATEVFIPQSDWNGDKLDGTGNSGKVLDPTKFNVYQIGVQYLGAGAIIFEVETASDGNNPNFVPVHVIKYPNTETKSSFGNPSFPFTMAAYSAGSTTDLAVRCSSFAGFVEGNRFFSGPRISYFNQSTGITAANFGHIFSVENSRYYKGRTNQIVINLLSLTVAAKHNNPITVYLVRNATLVGNPNFQPYSADSCALYDTAATSATFGLNQQLIWSGSVGETGSFTFSFEDTITIQPGEMISVLARTSTGAAGYVLVSLNTREDH